MNTGRCSLPGPRLESLAFGAGSASGLLVLSLFFLNQIKSWKQLKVHPLWGPVPVPLFNNKHGFIPGWPSLSWPGQGFAWEVERASQATVQSPVRGHDLLSSPIFGTLLALGSPLSTWSWETSYPLKHGVQSFQGLQRQRGALQTHLESGDRTNLGGHLVLYSPALWHLVEWLQPTVPQVPAKWVQCCLPQRLLSVFKMTVCRTRLVHSRDSINVHFLVCHPGIAHASIMVAFAISVQHQYESHFFLYWFTF